MDNALIPAATVLLLRDEPNFEVLMVERHADIKFAGGAMVFPGGKIAPGDSDQRWVDRCRSDNSFPDAERVARIAAIREAYEETGILIARHRDGTPITSDLAARLDQHRAAVEIDDTLFFDVVDEADVILDLSELSLFARWAPPKRVVHKRFDTWFFAARAPSGQTAREDGNEATEAVWTSPSQVLRDCRAGERKMIFPTIRNVELLNKSTSVGDVLSFAASRRIELIEPEIVERGGVAYLTIPDDMGYPVTEEPIETAFRS